MELKKPELDGAAWVRRSGAGEADGAVGGGAVAVAGPGEEDGAC